MNAIVGLCHFCEAHGPRPVFCTFTTDSEDYTTESSQCTVQCSGCTSLGPETVFISREDNGTIFCSRESVPSADVTAFLRQAAIRSITCEVSWSKEGGVVYFSDTHGHVLSLTFQVADTRARGLKRWFSIVVLMKDKMQLLNVCTMLSEHMKKISNDIQTLANTVFDNEQTICSQRALRLKTGRNDFGQSRSLMQLTGDEEIYKMLHISFTSMLRSGAHTYTETLYTSHQLLSKLNSSTNGSIFQPGVCAVPNCIGLRSLENLVSKDIFRKVLYCTLCGVNVHIKCKQVDPKIIISGLKRLVPEPAKHLHIGADSKVDGSCVLEENENNNFVCRWSGALPLKCPTLMNKIENAITNGKFNDDVLHQHVKSLQLEWLGIAKSLKAATGSSSPTSDAVVKLKQIFGVTPQDEQLIAYWMSTFC